MYMSPIMQMLCGIRGTHASIKITPEHEALTEKMINCDKELREKLKSLPELLELYDKVDDIHDKINCIETDIFYLEGFRFGAQIALDVMTPSEK